MNLTESDKKNFVYIQDIPDKTRRLLCTILDRHRKWKELGEKHMKYDILTLDYIEVKSSPTDELLNKWSCESHSVLELFIFLSRMQHYEAMVILKPFVDNKYYQLIYEGEHCLSNLLQKIKRKKRMHVT